MALTPLSVLEWPTNPVLLDGTSCKVTAYEVHEDNPDRPGNNPVVYTATCDRCPDWNVLDPNTNTRGPLWASESHYVDALGEAQEHWDSEHASG